MAIQAPNSGSQENLTYPIGSSNYIIPCIHLLGFAGGAVVKESTCQRRRCKRHAFDPWVGKILWRRKWQPAPVFLPGKSHGQRSLVGYTVCGVAKGQTQLSKWKPKQCTLIPNTLKYSSISICFSSNWKYCFPQRKPIFVNIWTFNIK